MLCLLACLDANAECKIEERVYCNDNNIAMSCVAHTNVISKIATATLLFSYFFFLFTVHFWFARPHLTRTRTVHSDGNEQVHDNHMEGECHRKLINAVRRHRIWCNNKLGFIPYWYFAIFCGSNACNPFRFFSLFCTKKTNLPRYDNNRDRYMLSCTREKQTKLQISLLDPRRADWFALCAIATNSNQQMKIITFNCR